MSALGDQLRALYPLFDEYDLSRFVTNVLEVGLEDDVMAQVFDVVVLLAAIDRARKTHAQVSKEWRNAKVMIRYRVGLQLDERTIADLLGIMEGVLAPVKLATFGAFDRDK